MFAVALVKNFYSLAFKYLIFLRKLFKLLRKIYKFATLHIFTLYFLLLLKKNKSIFTKWGPDCTFSLVTFVFIIFWLYTQNIWLLSRVKFDYYLGKNIYFSVLDYLLNIVWQISFKLKCILKCISQYECTRSDFFRRVPDFLHLRHRLMFNTYNQRILLVALAENQL